MEWYKNQFMEDVSFSDINEGILKDPHRIPPVFLPYLTGVNAPDFNENAGGGAKSALWTQLKSNITGQVIEVPENEEAPSFGAAIIGSVSEGLFQSFPDAVAQCVSMKKRYEPVKKDADDNTYQVFTELYDSLKDVYRLNRQKHS